MVVICEINHELPERPEDYDVRLPVNYGNHVFSITHNFLPNPGRNLSVLTLTGHNPLNVSADKILPEFDRKFCNPFEFSLNRAELSLNSVNSENLRNH